MREEETGAEVVGWAEEAMEETEVEGARDVAGVDAKLDEPRALEVASPLELDEAGTMVDPGAIGGTGVAT